MRLDGRKLTLTSCIPKLKSNSSIFQIHCFRKKINSDCGLICIIEWIVHESKFYIEYGRARTNRDVPDEHIPGDKRGFTDWLFAEKDQLELAKRISKVRGHFFLNKFMVFVRSLFSRLFTENLENIKRGKEININRLKWVITSSPSGMSRFSNQEMMTHHWWVTNTKFKYRL